MRTRVEKFIFFLLIFLIFDQLGKHFWPAFSFVSGIRVDYLSPTLHLTDVLVILLACSVLKEIRQSLQAFFKNQRIKGNPLIVTFFLILLGSTLLSLSPFAALWGSVKLVEFFFLAWYIATRFHKKDITLFVDVFSLAALLVSILALLQFFSQHSIGGMWYFFGERTLHTSLVGIATLANGGSILLRPYATFPHPNVLAFFLLSAAVFSCVKLLSEKNRGEKIFLSLTLLVSTLTLFLTFSRMIIVCFLVACGVFFFQKYRRLKNKRVYVGVVLGSIALYLFFFSSRFFNPESILKDFSYRADLVSIGFATFLKYPYLGVGMNNFFIHEVALQKTISPTLLQPIHNIYLLVFVQLGIVGGALFLWFLWKTLARVIQNLKDAHTPEVKNFSLGVLILYVSVLVVGSFDHFLLTLQQGQLLLAVVLGLAWSRLYKKTG